MKGSKILLSAICAFVAIAAAVAALYFFRNEIVNFFVEIKDKVDIKKFRRNGEYEDFADV